MHTMKRWVGIVGLIGAVSLANAEALTGDAGLACEAILCLSSGTQPNECSPSLSRYFSIQHDKLSDTLKARFNFLKLCPVTEQDTYMYSLLDAIVNGAGRCDASALNASLSVWRRGRDGRSRRVISNTLPEACQQYRQHKYTDFENTGARYVGTPEQGGYWVESADYSQAVKQYQEAKKLR